MTVPADNSLCPTQPGVLSPQDIREFQALVAKTMGVSLSYEQASARASQLLFLVAALLRDRGNTTATPGSNVVPLDDMTSARLQ